MAADSSSAAVPAASKLALTVCAFAGRGEMAQQAAPRGRS
jgi:hypothetical protein